MLYVTAPECQLTKLDQYIYSQISHLNTLILKTENGVTKTKSKYR